MNNDDSIHAPNIYRLDNFDFEFEPDFDMTNGPNETQQSGSEQPHSEDSHNHYCGPDCDCEDHDHDHEETDDASNSGHSHGPNKNASSHEHGHEDNDIIQSGHAALQTQNIFTAWDDFEFTAYNQVSSVFAALDFTAYNLALNVSMATAFNSGQGAMTNGMQSARFNMFEFADSTNLITPSADTVPADNTTNQ